jgi:hypothetical protein
MNTVRVSKQHYLCFCRSSWSNEGTHNTSGLKFSVDGQAAFYPFQDTLFGKETMHQKKNSIEIELKE